MNYTKAVLAGLLMTGSGIVAAEENWQYQLSPYLWFAGSKGDVASISGAPKVSFELTPSDALEDNEVSFMLIFQAKKNGRGYFIDGQYTDTRSDFDLVPELGLKARNTSKNTLVSAAYVHELMNDNKRVVDAFAGLRYWNVESILEFKGGLGLLAGTKLKSTEDWFDPMVGIKGQSPFGDSNFFSTAWLAVGGFGVGSDLFYDTSINVGYQWNKSIDTTLGYRLYDVDYRDGDYLYDVKNSGLMLGLSWKF